jgi:hypothetical protein
MPELHLERREQPDKGVYMRNPAGATIAMTPMVDEDYWAYRVKLNDTGQAVVGFPKFSTIGIGFAQESDWNTNLPYTCEAQEILDHILHNKGDDIPDQAAFVAIQMIRRQCTPTGKAAGNRRHARATGRGGPMTRTLRKWWQFLCDHSSPATRLSDHVGAWHDGYEAGYEVGYQKGVDDERREPSV